MNFFRILKEEYPFKKLTVNSSNKYLFKITQDANF
ncbi:MAG: hypothetical protein ACI9QC_000880, partial [Oceanicoccus sp.]